MYKNSKSVNLCLFQIGGLKLSSIIVEREHKWAVTAAKRNKPEKVASDHAPPESSSGAEVRIEMLCRYLPMTNPRCPTLKGRLARKA